MPPKRVIVIGAGAAGMSCAHQLAAHPSRFSVTLIESISRCGGQAFSIPLDASHHGASFLNQGVQGGSGIFRHTFAMFKQQGYPVHPVNLQISFGKDDKFWTNVFPTKLHEKHKDEIKKFRKVLKIIRKFELLFALVPIWLLLKMFRFSKEFGDYMIMPTLALFLGTGNATPEVNSVILERLFTSPTVGMWYDEEVGDKTKGKDGVLSGNNPPMVVFPNLSEFYETWRKDLVKKGVNVRLNTDLVRVIERGRKGVKVALKKKSDEGDSGDGEETTEEYDEIVFACQADTAKRLLGKQASWRERFVLGRTKWADDVTVTHWDSEYMEKHYTNCYDEEQAVEGVDGRDDSARIAQGKEFSPMYYIKPYDQEPDKLEMISDPIPHKYWTIRLT
ncbi:hypothetical protein H072_8159 [Dactylellina haptotyla CBS 200.50]|uniref:Amine oxidase domain-containing protein n=1 Tax=Dactylellina haptotyla (strain CBS 200.50) TaxID=1284197 RepID=S8BFT2_DACHA|nr:hypothetical protein H072_8159 [Dactylellina haptotyla CBS 200.50]